MRHRCPSLSTILPRQQQQQQPSPASTISPLHYFAWLMILGENARCFLCESSNSKKDSSSAEVRGGGSKASNNDCIVDRLTLPSIIDIFLFHRVHYCKVFNGRLVFSLPLTQKSVSAYKDQEPGTPCCEPTRADSTGYCTTYTKSTLSLFSSDNSKGSSRRSLNRPLFLPLPASFRQSVSLQQQFHPLTKLFDTPDDNS